MQRRSLVFSTGSWLTASIAGYAPRLGFAQDSVVRFGQSASLTGGQAKYGEAVSDGVLAAFQSANKQGKGPRLELVAVDDGGSKDKCVTNVKRFIESNAIGLIGLTSGAATEACIGLIEEAQIPLIGPATGNMGLRSEEAKHIFHVRAGYDDEYRKLIAHVKAYGLTRIGYVFLSDTTAANRDAMASALKAEGLQLKASVGIDRNDKTFDRAASQLMQAGVDSVVFTTNAAPILPIVDAMLMNHFPGMFFSSSFAGQSIIDSTLGSNRFVVMAQVVPRPMAEALPLVKAYQRDLAALGGDKRPGFTSLEGYIAGRVAIEATRLAATASGPITRARLFEALMKTKADFGGYSVAFAPNARQGSRFVDVIAFGKSGRIIG
jgi:ABC-type branched-subunit amino acid transport system substrate-binding protein